MRAGRLRKRVTLRRKTVTQNAFNEERITWDPVATVWASVEPLRGAEFLEQRREGAEVTTRIVIRYRDSVGPEMQVTYGDHTYDVVSVIHVEELQRELHLMCKELV